MFSFDPDKHIYTKGELVLPSITKILEAEGFIDTSFYTPAGALNGTIRHQVCHEYDTGELFEDAVAEEHRPYLEAYKKFLYDTDFQVEESEMPRYHPKLLYAGTPDKVGKMKGRPAVVEIKTGDLEPWTALQTAAQALMVQEDYEIENDPLAKFRVEIERYGLQLLGNATYRLLTFKDRFDRGVWQSALACYQWKRKYLRRE